MKYTFSCFGRLLVILLVIQLLTLSGYAGPRPGENTLTGEQKAAIIDTVTQAFVEYYVFLDDAKKMETLLDRNLKEGKYDAIKTLPEFAAVLTRELRSINNDRHITIDAMRPGVQVMDPTDTDDDKEKAIALKRMQEQNFLFRKVEILDGNIGYLRFDGFIDASVAGATAIAAMGFLAHCDAIIFDMRYNGGGNPSMIQLLTSYLVKEPTHLNSFYVRKQDVTQQFWTQAMVPGPSLADVDAYVLTSKFTFSGAEEFTYNLKNLKRATVIGETTGGGAHPVSAHPFPNLGISAIIPYGRAINPITGTNWEGTGVTPDIKVPAADALLTAQREALKKLKENTSVPGRQRKLEWALLTINSQLNPPNIAIETLRKYVGTFQDREIKLSDEGNLQYRRGERPWNALVAVTDTIFCIDGVDYFRLEVVLDDAGNPLKLVGHYADGRTDESLKTSD